MFGMTITIDGGWGWVVVFSTFMIHFICDGIMYTFGIFYVEFLRYFKSTKATTSLVMSIFIGMSYCTGPIASGLINSFGCRTVSLLGTLISTVGLCLSVVMPEVEYLILTIGILTGGGYGFLYVSTIVSVACHFEKKRAFAVGLSLAGSGTGAFAIAPLLEWLIVYYANWKGAMLIISGITLHCAVFSMFFARYHSPAIVDSSFSQPAAFVPIQGTELRDGVLSTNDISRRLQPIRRIHRTSLYSSCSVNDIGLINNADIFYSGRSSSFVAELPESIISPSISEASKRNYCSEFFRGLYTMMDLSLLSNYVFVIFASSNFIYNLGVYVPYVYTIHRAQEVGIATAYDAGLLMSIIGVANSIGRIVVGLWVDQTTLKILSVYKALLMIVGISTLITPLITKYYQMAIYCVVYGIAWGSSISLLSVILVELLGLDRLTNAFGLTLFSIGLATSVGTPLTGWLWDLSHSYDAGFILTGVLCLISFSLLLLIPVVEKKCPQ